MYTHICMIYIYIYIYIHPSSPVEAAVRAAQNAQNVSGRCFAVKVRPWESFHHAGLEGTVCNW